MDTGNSVGKVWIGLRGSVKKKETSVIFSIINFKKRNKKIPKNKVVV